MPESGSVGVEGFRDGPVGRIVLDRPRSLNAIGLSMIHRILELLEDWKAEPLRAITVESSTDGVFCAGGDIRQIRQNTLDRNPAASDEFFATEYMVNELLATYPTPVVALIDGVCMGGGLGLSVHGAFRVVTERAVLAMPETAIGFFPDVGASHFLSRLPGGVGTYLGLTGARLNSTESIRFGLATHHISSDVLRSVVERLADDPRPIDSVLRDLSTPPAFESGMTMERSLIDSVFTASTIDEILRRLGENSSEGAVETLGVLELMSRQSLELTLDLLLWGKQRTLRECLEAEREAARLVVASTDFIEGVRAALVDKDRQPIWAASRYGGMTERGEIRWNS